MHVLKTVKLDGERMKYYFAPMEGITLYPLRNVHREVFGDYIDRYFSPFLTANKDYHFKNRERKDLFSENNSLFADYEKRIIPQIMSGNSETFLWAAREIRKMGYRHVNLNLGCPAATVVNRHKGAGLLTDTDHLSKMLSEIYGQAYCDGAPKEEYPEISIKTRLGFYDEEEAERLMQIYAVYPLRELIIHARVREDYYKKNIRPEAFVKAVEIYRRSGGMADICYNGDITMADSFEKLFPKMEDVDSIMIGRGLLTNPALVREIKTGEKLRTEELRHYLSRLYEEYAAYIPEDRNVICKMLEHWAFLYVHFHDCDKYLKAIRKSHSRGEYKAAVNNIFSHCEFI